MVFKWWSFLFYFVFVSRRVSSYFVMNNSCGIDQFEKSPSLNGFVYEVYTLGSHNAINYLTCAVDCFYNVNCLSIVFDEDTSSCFKYLTHMKDSYTRRSTSAAAYLQLKDPDSCADSVGTCDVNAVCLDKRHDDTCMCNPGFSGDGLTCSDENECDTGSSNCDPNADCTNIVGSYSCACKPGFNGDGKTCADENECDTGSNNCDPNADCTNIVGSYSCACKPGFNGDGKTCADENECDTGSNKCDSNADCTNIVGSYSCACKPGFNGDGRTCADENECDTGSNNCDPNADCTNIVGSYSCACKPGFNGNGKTCADNNECSTPGVCHVNADCTNSQGSYTCRCNNMYEGDGVNCILKAIKGQTCTQTSDCIRDNFICSSGLCDCGVGYSYDSNSNTCVTTCSNYGTDFSHQSTTYCITGYNNAVKSVNAYIPCRNYCLQASAFTCKTFELWNGKCYLSAVSKTEVPASKWSTWTGCKYYQRHCA